MWPTSEENTIERRDQSVVRSRGGAHTRDRFLHQTRGSIHDSTNYGESVVLRDIELTGGKQHPRIGTFSLSNDSTLFDAPALCDGGKNLSALPTKVCIGEAGSFKFEMDDSQR